MTQLEAARPPALVRRVRRGPASATSSRLRRAGLFTPTGYLATLTCSLLAFVVIAGPHVWGDSASVINVPDARLGPTWEHPFGTDNAGRDVLARMLAAGRLSIGLAIATAVLGAAMGISLGAINGVLGPRARRVLAEAINLLLAFPGILVALFLTAIFGPGLLSAVAALSIASAPGFARLAQTLTASLARADFVSAARLAGFSRARILFRHVLPNVAEPLVLTTASAAGASLLAFASLSFLGLGIQPPNYDWGRVLSEGLERLYVAPVAAMGPAVIIILTGMSFNLVGDLLARLVATAPSNATAPPRAAGPATGPRPGAGSASAVPGSTSGVRDQPADGGPDAQPLVLDVRDLRVAFNDVPVVDGVDLQVRPGERIAVVGESGSGKTLMVLSASCLAIPGATVRSHQHHFEGQAAASAEPATLGTRMALVFQDPLSSWNPALRVGTQMTEATMVHQSTGKKAAFRRAAQLLGSVRITAPTRRISQFPHELSGGMRQRAAIASGLMTTPSLLIADEPTTALDVTVQQQVLKVLRDATQSSGAALVLITHDLGVVGELCDRVVVMYAGRIVEDAPRTRLVRQPAHPYTTALLSTMPDLDLPLDRPLPSIPGQPPEPGAKPSGCPFRVRCSAASEICSDENPPLTFVGEDHRVACWHPNVTPDEDVERSEDR